MFAAALDPSALCLYFEALAVAAAGPSLHTAAGVVLAVVVVVVVAVVAVPLHWPVADFVAAAGLVGRISLFFVDTRSFKFLI